MFDLRSLIKYLLEGLAVAVAAYLIPKKTVDPTEIILIALTAAAVFAVLDYFAPGVAMGARQGAGFGIGYGQIAMGGLGLEGFAAPRPGDRDGDGIPNRYDIGQAYGPDHDLNGIPDRFEYGGVGRHNRDRNHDGIPDRLQYGRYDYDGRLFDNNGRLIYFNNGQLWDTYGRSFDLNSKLFDNNGNLIIFRNGLLYDRYGRPFKYHKKLWKEGFNGQKPMGYEGYDDYDMGQGFEDGNQSSEGAPSTPGGETPSMTTTTAQKTQNGQVKQSSQKSEGAVDNQNVCKLDGDTCSYNPDAKSDQKAYYLCKKNNDSCDPVKACKQTDGDVCDWEDQAKDLADAAGRQCQMIDSNGQKECRIAQKPEGFTSTIDSIRGFEGFSKAY